jgi:hypothetical protein
MSIEAVVPPNSRSFVYEGCYRPRGSLTFAERSAWGLRSSGQRPPAARTSAPVNIARTLPSRSKPLTCAQRPQRQGSRNPYTIEKHLKRERRFRVCSLSSVALRYTKTLANQRASVRPKQLAGWLRLQVKVGGGPVTCLVTPRRSFVAGHIGPKAGLQ